MELSYSKYTTTEGINKRRYEVTINKRHYLNLVKPGLFRPM